jgi:hypothetical protein
MNVVITGEITGDKTTEDLRIRFRPRQNRSPDSHRSA